MKFDISWNFVGLCAICLASGSVLVFLPALAGIGTFVFGLSGWLIGLCLHEYAHAVTAARFGDTSVKPRGYLTLDPLQYFHGASFILPLIALAWGGVALPGGAVMIRTDLIRKAWQQSLVALAGPFATLGCTLVSYVLALAIGDGPVLLHDGLILLTFFNLMAFVLNMLPLPGLDGFAAVSAFLPAKVRNLVPPKVSGMIQLGMLLLVFWQGARIIFPLIGLVVYLTGMDLGGLGDALHRFQFWKGSAD